MEVARLKEQIRAAWDVILLEKDVGLAPLPSAPGQPTEVDYRRTLGARYVPPADPVYAVGWEASRARRAWGRASWTWRPAWEKQTRGSCRGLSHPIVAGQPTTDRPAAASTWSSRASSQVPVSRGGGGERGRRP